MTLPEFLPAWMVEQLHLSIDNLHIQNTGQTTIELSLFRWDGATWKEHALGQLDPTDHQYFALKPLSVLFPGQSRPKDESVLVVRAPEIKKGQSVIWRIDNIHSAILQMSIFSPSGSFSRNSASKLLGSYTLQPKSYGWGLLTTFSLEPLDAHWEYWFDDNPMWPKPIP